MLVKQKLIEMDWLDFKTTPPTENTILVYIGNQDRDGVSYPGHIHLASLRYIGSSPEWVATDSYISDPWCRVCGGDLDGKIMYWMKVPESPIFHSSLN